MKLRHWIVLLASLALAAGASAAPISMSPGSVNIDTVFGIGNDFSITFDGGDTSDNILAFTAEGSGSGGSFPSTALVAIVFDGTDILDAGDTAGGWFNPNNVVRGIALPGTGVAAALLVDAGSPNAESFWIQLATSPSTATIYSLSLGSLSAVDSLQDVYDNIIDSQTVSFSYEGSGGGGGATPVPEPSAAFIFGLGLLITRSAIRRKRR